MADHTVQDSSFVIQQFGIYLPPAFIVHPFADITALEPLILVLELRGQKLSEKDFEGALLFQVRALYVC